MAVEALERPALDRSLVDRWIYVAITGLFVTTAVVGFAPRSIEIVAGERQNPALVVHIHAAMMAAWMSLLLAQALLMAVGRPQWHKTLGLTSLALGAAVFAAMIAVAIHRYAERYEIGALQQGANTLLIQGRSILYFAVFFVWAILVREKDSETHKRMMLLATVVLLPAAIARMLFLPNALPESYDALHAYMLLLLVPGIAYDIVRRGRPHSAYLIGLALLAPWIVLTHVLWSSPWWVETARKLMGYG